MYDASFEMQFWITNRVVGSTPTTACLGASKIYIKYKKEHEELINLSSIKVYLDLLY